MTYVEAEISCHRSECEAVRLRPLTRADNVTVITVLDSLGPTGRDYMRTPAEPFFFQSFVQAGLTYWDSNWAVDPYSTPIEHYFTHPGSPYAAARAEGSTWRGAEIYPIGSTLFSRRFTQLINTFWIANVAPFLVSSGLEFNATVADDPTLRQNPGPWVGSAEGTLTPDILIMRPSKPWLVVLFVSSIIMLAASIVAAVLGFLREGPDVLDRATSFLEYSYSQQGGSLVRSDTQMSMRTPSWKQQQIKLG